MYFTNPATICSSGEKEDKLIFQEGATYLETDKLVAVASTWNEAQNDKWRNQNYFPTMGHHILPYEVDHITYYYYAFGNKNKVKHFYKKTR